MEKIRMRRLRAHPKLRDLIRETDLTTRDLVLPLFVRHGQGVKNPISSMPGQFQLSVDQLAPEIDEIVQLGIPSILLFGIPAKKDGLGSEAYQDDGVIQTALRFIKERAPELFVITDACFCNYTDHGHCGIIHTHRGRADVDNDATLELLERLALSHAQAGSDMIAPSGMMDGMVRAMRKALDNSHFESLPILSYAAKYASSLYASFRDAAECAPQFGDRKTYQMDPGNGGEALKEVHLDLTEGADIVMVKPALAYLDIIYRLHQGYPDIPIAAYQVSGEYSMIKAAAQNGWIDEQKVVMETLTSIKRAGARFILTYFAKDVARWLACK
jgi:porphobilinogen synthase